MSAVVGVDLSSFAVDLVKLDEDSNRAEWVRCELVGKFAWNRTLTVRPRMPRASYWEDVYLAAIETPFPDQQGVLRRVQGAVMACIPYSVEVWEANASEWKKGLGLRGKPSWSDLSARSPGWTLYRSGIAGTTAFDGGATLPSDDLWQNGRDAFCIALFARDTNAAAVDVSEEATG